MADEALAKAGLHFDDLNAIRVLEPQISQETLELKEECHDFIEKMTEFKRIVAVFVDVINKVSEAVEKEKLKAIGSRNLLKSMEKQREAQQQQLLALLSEKKMQLERLRVQHEALQKQEAEQNDFIEQFILNK
ncbi:unnamed protein product [Dimorphilus gyrociliatus]|uniref:Uncharacterized protein n=1 Tax=Dimorphilus gyrociliatus TaxID=2664684 RepID=A0A7I8W4M3_9ANNE|nr:unnamed protein product [Dimorphilus gyrociliatus]